MSSNGKIFGFSTGRQQRRNRLYDRHHWAGFGHQSGTHAVRIGDRTIQQPCSRRTRSSRSIRTATPGSWISAGRPRPLRRQVTSAQNRAWSNLTDLADGTVLLTGGSNGLGPSGHGQRCNRDQQRQDLGPRHRPVDQRRQRRNRSLLSLKYPALARWYRSIDRRRRPWSSDQPQRQRSIRPATCSMPMAVCALIGL